MKIFEKMNEYVREQKPFVLTTLVDARGSVPQEAGARMMVDRNGLVAGTVGGGEAEKRALEQALKLLESNDAAKTLFVTWNLQQDFHMNCGGEIRLYFEKWNRAEWNFRVFGAGHVAQAVIPLLLTLDARVTCVDSRQEWLDRLPKNDRLRNVCVPEDQFSTIASEGAWHLIMTRDHSLDAEVASAILEKGHPPYLGVIGSRLKAAKMKESLAAQGIAKDRIDSIRCPIGLPFGKNTPAEIAISIGAQLLTVRDALDVNLSSSGASKREAKPATGPLSL